MSENTKRKNSSDVGIGGYIALVLILIFFSGIMKDLDNPLRFFDYSVLSGSFGTIGETVDNFQGSGGDGARAGFLFAINLIPNVMLAIGAVAVAEHFGAIKAAGKLLTPLLSPLLGIPGTTGLALITSLQSTDAGASMTRILKDQNRITQDELNIFSTWQFSAGGLIGNFFGTGAGLWALTNAQQEPAMEASMMVVFLVIFVMKFVGANIMRALSRGEKSTTRAEGLDEREEAVEEAQDQSGNVVTVFVSGAKNGYDIGVGSVVPNVLMAFVVIKALNVTGAMDALGALLAPAMALFGLPGEAAAVLLGSFMSMGGGVGVAGALFADGVLTGRHLTILAPAMFLMGSLIQYSGRLLQVAQSQRQGLQFVICFINAIISMVIMNIII